MTITVNFKSLNTNSKRPVKASDGAGGFDLYVSSATAKGGGVSEYGTGIAVQIPDGYVGLLFPRSSISERGQVFCNSVGVIDSDYRGEIKIRTSRVSDVWDYYKIGERCGQLMIIPVAPVLMKAVAELDVTERGTGGFGSTGK